MHDSDVSRYQAGAREMATDWTELNELAVSLAWADDWGERAFEVNSKIITLDRCCTAALNRLARCYLCANNPDAARATYERVLLIDPENRIAINGRKSLVSPQQLIQEDHKKRILAAGLPYHGTRQPASRSHRVTHCWRCAQQLDNTVDLECVGCGWIICACGACGCEHA